MGNCARVGRALQNVVLRTGGGAGINIQFFPPAIDACTARRDPLFAEHEGALAGAGEVATLRLKGADNFIIFTQGEACREPSHRLQIFPELFGAHTRTLRPNFQINLGKFCRLSTERKPPKNFPASDNASAYAPRVKKIVGGRTSVQQTLSSPWGDNTNVNVLSTLMRDTIIQTLLRSR